MYNILKELTEQIALPGNEAGINNYLENRWAPRCQKIWQTGVGNLIAHIGGNGPALLIDAHADEHGFLVKSILDGGFISLDHTGGYDAPPWFLHAVGQPAIAVGSRGNVDGVLAAATGHILNEARRQKGITEWREIFLEVGANSCNEVLDMGIDIGTPVCWTPSTRRINNLIVGKAMDDRAGLAVMDVLLEHIETTRLRFNLYFSSTVQEELGMVGASSILQEIKPDIALCLDCGLAGDIPNIESSDMPVHLGKGPVLVHKDRSVHFSPRLIKELLETAGRSSLPVQQAVFGRYASDGTELVRQGVETALLAPPVRYTHSPFEAVKEEDLVGTVDLLKAFLEG